MINFLGPPTEVFDGIEWKPIEYKGDFHGHGWHKGEFTPPPSGIGVYGITGTGCFYSYWDGEYWWDVGKSGGSRINYIVQSPPESAFHGRVYIWEEYKKYEFKHDSVPQCLFYYHGD